MNNTRTISAATRKGDWSMTDRAGSQQPMRQEGPVCT